jgi:hypothetical protein
MVIEPENCRIQYHHDVHFWESLPVSQIKCERHNSSEEIHDHIDSEGCNYGRNTLDGQRGWEGTANHNNNSNDDTFLDVLRQPRRLICRRDPR